MIDEPMCLHLCDIVVSACLPVNTIFFCLSLSKLFRLFFFFFLRNKMKIQNNVFIVYVDKHMSNFQQHSLFVFSAVN